MLYVGIHSGHDAGISIHDNSGNLIYFTQIERITRKKHTNSIIHDTFSGFDIIKSVVHDEDFIILTDNLYELNSDIIKYFSSINEKICISLTDIFPNLKNIYSVSHHIAHTFSAYSYRETDESKFFLSLDGGGHYANTNATSSVFGNISVFGPNILESDFAWSTHCLNTIMGGWSAGKLMGLAGYYTEAVANNLTNENLIECCKKKNNYTVSEYLLMAGYYKFIINGLKSQIEKTFSTINKPITGLCISGGTHLSLELNSWLYNTYTSNIDFCPATDDSGICLGLSAYGYFKSTKKMPKKINTAFIQQYTNTDPYDNISIGELAKRLYLGKIIGIVRGKPECGPRALGHRSILANPTDPLMYQKVSLDLKNREFYRPIAPIVTEKCFNELFIGPKGKYMQYRVMCKDETKIKCPAIYHTDSSSRPQVVTESSDKWMYNLLVEFGKLSGVECLINTSLNRNGPICNTYADAKNDFINQNIELYNFYE